MDFNKTRYIPMSRRRRIYEGKAKVLYEGPEPGTLIQHFKDDATAFNAKKHQVIEGKGVLNNRISEYLFQHLNDIGVPTHFIRRLNMREQLIREVEIVPLEVVVRNVAAGSLSQRLGIEEGTQLPSSITRTTSSTTPWCRRSTSPHSAGPRRRKSMTSWRSPSASTTS
jgi:phosphoribosylaminoimidazole-succinocarboxamide synthase